MNRQLLVHVLAEKLAATKMNINLEKMSVSSNCSIISNGSSSSSSSSRIFI